MFKKVTIITACLFLLGFGLVFAQQGGNLMAFAQQQRGNVDVTLDVRMNVAEIHNYRFSDEDTRLPARDTLSFTWANFGPLEGEWFTRDSVIRFSYETDVFGGSLVLRPADFGTPPWRAFFNLGHFRVTAGNDIESIFADPQGADPGLRVFNGGRNRSAAARRWNDYVNPDNITQDEGLLLEGFFGDLSVGLTGFVFGENSEFRIPATPRFLVLQNRNFRFGGRIAYEIGDFGRINASYFLHYTRLAPAFIEIPIGSQQLRPTNDARTEVYRHFFGLYASLNPIRNLGITVGYAGILTQYLPEFWDASNHRVQQTVQPNILQNAVMLNARVTDLVPGLTLRTDHNFSFWTDKDLSTLAALTGWTDRTFLSTTQHPNAPDVSHFLLWNGFGISYQLTDLIGLELYTRNLHRRDRSLGGGGQEFVLERNEFSIEPKLILVFNEFVQFSFAVQVFHTTTTASRDLNVAGRNDFRPGAEIRETRDSVMNVFFPIGVTMRF